MCRCACVQACVFLLKSKWLCSNNIRNFITALMVIIMQLCTTTRTTIVKATKLHFLVGIFKLCDTCFQPIINVDVPFDFSLICISDHLYIYALKWLSAHSCGDTLYSVTSTDIMHWKENEFLDLIVPFQKAPFMNKTPSRVPPKCLCWAESYYGPAYFPIETDKWPFDEAALWPFSQSWVNKWEMSVWGFEGYRRMKNRKKRTDY